MDSIDYYNDTKYCPKCDQYVLYLRSIQACYCTECGGQVKLFSKADWEEFQRLERGSQTRAQRNGFARTPGLEPETGGDDGDEGASRRQGQGA